MFGGEYKIFLGRGKFPLWMPRINTERELNVNLYHDVHLDHDVDVQRRIGNGEGGGMDDVRMDNARSNGVTRIFVCLFHDIYRWT